VTCSRSLQLYCAMTSLASRYVSATLDITGQQPVDAHAKLFLYSNQNVRGRGNDPSLIFRKLTLANAELASKFVLSDVESSQLPDPSPKRSHIGHDDFFAAQFSA
jgi:hypothetical protein